MTWAGKAIAAINCAKTDERNRLIELLEKAFTEASKLSEQEQEALAVCILEELASERCWIEAFADSEDALAVLADEALAEYREGHTPKLNPDAL